MTISADAHRLPLNWLKNVSSVDGQADALLWIGFTAGDVDVTAHLHHSLSILVFISTLDRPIRHFIRRYLKRVDFIAFACYSPKVDLQFKLYLRLNPTHSDVIHEFIEDLHADLVFI